MIKLVALDLDGTLVNEDLEISPRTISTLHRIQADQGIKVVVATGRMFPSAIPFARSLNVTNPLISYQGAMIRDISEPLEVILDHPIHFHRTIDMAVTRAIIDTIHERNFHTNIYINDRLFTTTYNATSQYYQKISGVTPQEVTSLHSILDAPPTKIMIIDDAADDIVAYLKSRFPTQINVCKSRANFCEIVDSAVSKWDAIQQLLPQWGILPEEVMAIGDHENDLPMIQGAGIGVAMGNAPENVKVLANFVTDTIENDGVAQAIEKFVYGHLPLMESHGAA